MSFGDTDKNTDTLNAAVPENFDAPCNICGRGWPYHYERCAYRVHLEERDALAAALTSAQERERTLRDVRLAALKAVGDAIEGSSDNLYLAHRILANANAEGKFEGESVVASSGGQTQQHQNG